jgi:hypothetical protein
MMKAVRNQRKVSNQCKTMPGKEATDFDKVWWWKEGDDGGD